MGLFEGALISREQVESIISATIVNALPVLNPEQFRMIANGVFQSDGSLTASIKLGYIMPAFNLVQNMYPQSLVFFGQLYHQLGGLVSIRAVVTLSGV